MVIGYGGTFVSRAGTWAIVFSALMIMGAFGLFAGCVRVLVAYRRSRP